MTPAEELYHQVLQKMIIVFLGLLSLSVFLTSCTTNQKACAAYDTIQIDQTPGTVDQE